MMAESGRAGRNGTNRGWGQRESAYSRWLRSEGVPVYGGSFVADLRTAPVAPWPRIGQRGALVSLASQQQTDGWLMEIAPGEHTEPIHHLFECSYYVLHGTGATAVWAPGASRKLTLEWAPGSLFSPPLNCYYQHFSLDGAMPARLYSPTTGPLMMNALQDTELVFDCDHVFPERYSGDQDYFSRSGEKIDSREWDTNFIPDVRLFRLEDRSERGAGSSIMFFRMSGNAMNIHISEFPPGSYKKAHRHGPGAEIVILNGTGYSLLWRPGAKEKTRVDWREGSVFSPAGGEYHQHFNTGLKPARYLAYTFGSIVVSDSSDMGEGARLSERDGGWQIEYEDEDPEVFELFARECARNGSVVTLDHPRRRV